MQVTDFFRECSLVHDEGRTDDEPGCTGGKRNMQLKEGSPKELPLSEYPTIVIIITVDEVPARHCLDEFFARVLRPLVASRMCLSLFRELFQK